MHWASKSCRLSLEQVEPFKQGYFKRPQDYWYKNQGHPDIPPELAHCASISEDDLKKANHRRAIQASRMRIEVFNLCKEEGQADRPAGYWEYAQEDNTYHIVAWLTFKQAQKVAIRTGTVFDNSWIN